MPSPLSSQPVTLAVDAMSGDHGTAVTVPAVLDAVRRHSGLRVILAGDRDALGSAVGGAEMPRIEIEHASQVVGMQEHPRDALRGKRDSSMRRALETVRDGRADACVSAGNTGALVATSRFVLKTLEGVDRPAIISAIPARGGHTFMLDLGANAGCTAEHLFQFAVMGSVIAADLQGTERPAVALLNIGEEDIKGTDTIRHAAELLGASDLDYIGFIEANDIFTGRADVVVTDGFSGNVALKTMEGSARHLAGLIREEALRTPLRRAMAALAAPLLRAVRVRLDPRRYNGASLVGLRGVVIKSHGAADPVAFGNALDLAVLEAQKGVPTHIGARLGQLTPKLEAV